MSANLKAGVRSSIDIYYMHKTGMRIVACTVAPLTAICAGIEGKSFQIQDAAKAMPQTVAEHSLLCGEFSQIYFYTFNTE